MAVVICLPRSISIDLQHGTLRLIDILGCLSDLLDTTVLYELILFKSCSVCGNLILVQIDVDRFVVIQEALVAHLVR